MSIKAFCYELYITLLNYLSYPILCNDITLNAILTVERSLMIVQNRIVIKTAQCAKRYDCNKLPIDEQWSYMATG